MGVREALPVIILCCVGLQAAGTSFWNSVLSDIDLIDGRLNETMENPNARPVFVPDPEIQSKLESSRVSGPARKRVG